jgi:hypothetical protein
MGVREDIQFALINGGRPAFPVPDGAEWGMTTREYLIGQAITGAALEIAGGMVEAGEIACSAVLLADLVLLHAGRSQPGPKLCSHCNCTYYTDHCTRCENAGVDLAKDLPADAPTPQRPEAEEKLVPRPESATTMHRRRGSEGKATVGE